jgi:hypothetical protein
MSPNCLYIQYLQQAAQMLLEYIFSQIAHKIDAPRTEQEKKHETS